MQLSMLAASTIRTRDLHERISKRSGFKIPGPGLLELRLVASILKLSRVIERSLRARHEPGVNDF
jgi:hypothetical protein